MNALRWLKIHNSIYSNTVINEEWSKQSAVNGATLFDALTNKSFENNSSSNDMFSRLCSTSFCDPVAISSDIVSELDARIIQGYRMLTFLASQRGFSIQDVPADGDCLFSAISLQLESVGIQIDARIIQGYRMLTFSASQRGFSIQDVPADGDCLFSAISLQLESVGIQPAESKELRHELVKYMEQNPTINEDLYYRDFLSE